MNGNVGALESFLKYVKQILGVVAWLIVIHSGAGCMFLSDPRDTSVGFDDQARYEEEGDPKIHPGLVLKLMVTASGAPAVPEMIQEVDSAGNILMPYIGSVACDGLTLVALQEKLREAYKNYFLDPQVTIAFAYAENSGMKSPWGSVLVTGCVTRPGPVNMPSTRDLNVTRALMLAGNVTPLADKTRVRVTRREKDGKLKRFMVDIDLIGKEGRSELDVMLKPGDVIWVPESWY